MKHVASEVAAAAAKVFRFGAKERSRGISAVLLIFLSVVNSKDASRRSARSTNPFRVFGSEEADASLGVPTEH